MQEQEFQRTRGFNEKTVMTKQDQWACKPKVRSFASNHAINECISKEQRAGALPDYIIASLSHGTRINHDDRRTALGLLQGGHQRRHLFRVTTCIQQEQERVSEQGKPTMQPFPYALAGALVWHVIPLLRMWCAGMSGEMSGKHLNNPNKASLLTR